MKKVYLLTEEIDLGYRVLKVYATKSDAEFKCKMLEDKRKEAYRKFMQENNRKPNSSDEYVLNKSDYKVLEFDVL